jgi:DNA-binding transcriptional LysR family regulator
LRRSSAIRSIVQRWLGLDLRQFEALRVLADEGSFRQAAARLGYTQPAISHQLAALERVVGETLVARPRGLRPLALTKAGELVLRHAVAIQSRLTQLDEELRALASGANGALRIGSFQSIGATILPPILEAFSRSFPAVQVSVSDSLTGGSFENLLERGDLDLAFVDSRATSLALEPLLLDEYVLLTPDSSSLAREGKPVPLDRLKDMPLIAPRTCRCLTQLVPYLRSQGIEPRLVFQSDDNATIAAMVGAGLGIGLLPRLAVSGVDGLQIVKLEGDIPPRTVAIAWSAERPLSSAASAFIEITRTVCLPGTPSPAGVHWLKPVVAA